ncbi:orotidine-5'-phosphate decarboxylase [candidate division WOR-3 bacterium]|nr:orotidine-5'-phosphate decarboxylase [candidate division WOR-3 bacterium]
MLEPSKLAAADRLIVALDFPNAKDALGLVDKLEGAVGFYKVGLELFVATGLTVVQELKRRGFNVFLDMKMDDVEETIERAVRQVVGLNVQFLTIHGSGATADAAVRGRGNSALKIFQITVLTSLNEQDLRDLGLVGPKDRARFQSLQDYVEWRAAQSLGHHCDGLITSGQNVGRLRELFAGKHPILVCPGIRPSGTTDDDHKRPSTPYNAIMNGADYLVVGRPIRNAEFPRDRAQRIIDEIAKAQHDRSAPQAL